MAIIDNEQETSTKERILRLAIDALDSGGEASIRVKQIADDAGVSVTSLYHFYGSREGLVEAALVHRFDDGYRHGRAATRQAAENAISREEFADTLEALIRHAFGPAFTAARRRRINVAGSAMSRPTLLTKVNDAQREWFSELHESLLIAQRRGFIDPTVDMRAAATWHLITANGLASVEGDSTGADLGAWLDMYVDTMFRLIGLR